jgi:hypothetical protein
MKHTARIVLTLSLVVLLGSSLLAAEAQKKGRKGKKGQQARKPSVTWSLPKEVQSTLTDEQKKKIVLMDKEFGPKLAEFNKKRAAILSPEQRKAQAAARKAGTEAGKKGKELRVLTEAATKATEEQKKKLAELFKEQAPLRKIVQEKLRALLTDEQKALFPKRTAGKGRGGKGKAKGKKADK